MLRTSRLICAATPFLLLCAQVPEPKAKLTAREMFFADRGKGCSPRGATANRPAQSGASKGRKSAGTKAVPAEPGNEQKTDPVASSPPPPQVTPAPEPSRSGTNNIVQAAHLTGTPLGLRYPSQNRGRPSHRNTAGHDVPFRGPHSGQGGGQ